MRARADSPGVTRVSSFEDVSVFWNQSCVLWSSKLGYVRPAMSAYQPVTPELDPPNTSTVTSTSESFSRLYS